MQAGRIIDMSDRAAQGQELAQTERAAPRYRLGIDIGGTFTDLVLLDEVSGRLLIEKVLTTPRDPAAGVLEGTQRLLAQQAIAPEAVPHCLHATTLITNALIERTGARTGLLTTHGFRDVLQIGRELRYDLYDLFLELPPPLCERAMRAEVHERIRRDGAVQTPLDDAELRQQLRELTEAGAESIAVVFLHSYMNSAHEEAAERIAREEFPGVFLSASYRIAREVREYERTSTTVANAYVQPLAARYLRRLGTGLRDLGLRGRLALMTSAGGIVSEETARAVPISLVESGPAAGAIAGAFCGELAGERYVIALDMGGTTAKACVVDDGQPLVTYTFEAARMHRFKRGSGLPLRIPAVDLIEIGAGGGSIARTDRLGLLTVGPQSAGSDPGPACYGRGGEDPTVTDADLLLGYLDPGYFLGGEMRLVPDAARRAVANRLAQPLGRDPVTVAWGIHNIVNENMASAARVHLAERGRDPRAYALIATGGAGPVHAQRIARKLRVRRVLCPLGSGVASTIGLLVAQPRTDLVHAYVARLDELEWERLNAIYAGMRDRAIALLGQVGISAAEVQIQPLADLRYVGQGFEVVTALPPGPYAAASAAEIARAFEAAYQTSHGRTMPTLPIEGLNWRLRASGPRTDARRVAEALHAGRRLGTGGPALRGKRLAYFPERGGFISTPVYNRYALRPGECLAGPALVEERESTVVVGPDAMFSVDRYQTLTIEVEGANRGGGH
jgi:N-methylhydantoinase A